MGQIIDNANLPVCPYCHGKPVIEKLPGTKDGDVQTFKHFVMCKTDECSIRKDTHIKTIGRVLTNGHEGQLGAEKEWGDFARTDTYKNILAGKR